MANTKEGALVVTVRVSPCDGEGHACAVDVGEKMRDLGPALQEAIGLSLSKKISLDRCTSWMLKGTLFLCLIWRIPPSVEQEVAYMREELFHNNAVCGKEDDHVYCRLIVYAVALVDSFSDERVHHRCTHSSYNFTKASLARPLVIARAKARRFLQNR